MKNFKEVTEEEREKIKLERINNPFISTLEVANKYDVREKAIRIFYQKNNLTTLELTGIRCRKYSVNDNYFNKIDSHEKAYLLGVMYSDGYLVIEGTKTKRIGLDVKDVDWLQGISNELGSTAPLYKTNKENMKRLKITSVKLYEDLIKLGCVEHKTKILTFPTEEQVPREYIYSFILGLTDGDGSVSIFSRGDYGWSLTGTKELLEGVKTTLKLTNKLYCRWPDRDNSNYTLQVHGVQCVANILLKLYENTPDFCLKRKYNNYLTIINDSRVKL